MSAENNPQIIDINGRELKVYSIEGSLGEENPKLRSKLVSREDLDMLGEFRRNRQQKIAFTTGVFDMIHIGHVRYLELARSLGNVLVVGLNTDESVRQLKEPDRPILPEIQRAEMLSFLGAVDYITLYPETAGSEAIRALKPDVYLCVEGSWEGDIATKEEVQAMVEHGGKVYYTPRQEPWVSTSTIIDKISERAGERLLEEFTSVIRQRREDT